MRWRSFLVAVVGTSTPACGSGELELPAEAELAGLYGEASRVTLNGNVVDVTHEQPTWQIRRGGDLWARVGPYIFLFSPQTKEIFEAYDGVAAVRVRTLDGRGQRIAEALLVRDTLTSVTWREAHRRVARARLEGTENPGNLEDLVRFGEDYTRFEYDPDYVRR